MILQIVISETYISPIKRKCNSKEGLRKTERTGERRGKRREESRDESRGERREKAKKGEKTIDICT